MLQLLLNWATVGKKELNIQTGVSAPGEQSEIRKL